VGKYPIRFNVNDIIYVADFYGNDTIAEFKIIEVISEGIGIGYMEQIIYKAIIPDNKDKCVFFLNFRGCSADVWGTHLVGKLIKSKRLP